MITHTLRDKTLKLLRERPANVPLSFISEETSLPLSWLKKFHANGDNRSSQVCKVQTLYEHLTKKVLKV